VKEMTVRTVGKIMMSAGAIALALIVVGYWIALRNRERAEEFLPQFVSLQLGQSTFNDGRQLAQAYQGKPWSPSSANAECSSQDCNLKFVFDNRPLHYLPFVRRVVFTASIGIKGGRIVAREVEYERDSRSYYDFIYVIRDSVDESQTPCCVAQKLKIDPAGIPHVIEIHLGPLATAQERALAYDLNLTCLSQFSGCANAMAIFPPSLRAND
jgi:hypothetical protein